MDYLNFNALLDMCKVHQRFNHLIATRRIYKEMLVLHTDENDEFDPIVFDMLPHAKKLEFILDEHYERVIEEIVSRCDDGQFKEAIIYVFRYNPGINSKFQQFVQKMNNLECLTLDMEDSICLRSNILSMIITEKLQKIQFCYTDGFHFHSIFAHFPTLKNLNTLCLNFCEDIPYDEFNEALKTIGGQLQEFAWIYSKFSDNSDDLELCGMIAKHMPNLIVLHLIDDDVTELHATENDSGRSIFEDLLALVKLRSLHIHSNACVCNNFNEFLNRLCALRQLESLDFTWAHLFSSNGKCFYTDEKVQPTRCQNLQLVPRLSLGCSLPLAEWNQIEDILPYLQEFYFLNPMDFDRGSIRDHFTYMLINGRKLESLNVREINHLTTEFYEVLKMMCKMYRNGKSIRLRNDGVNTNNSSRNLKDCYRSKYLKFQLWE